jgi:hypothetical protein
MIPLACFNKNPSPFSIIIKPKYYYLDMLKYNFKSSANIFKV